MDHDLWEGVGRLIDRAPSLGDLRAHRLQLLAAQRWRAAGYDIPAALAKEEMTYQGRFLAAQHVLSAVRNAYDGDLIVLKGPAVAVLYPDPTRRPFMDLDILAEDADGAQRTLLAAGFKPFGPHGDDYYHGLQHLRPLFLEGYPSLRIEIHRHPNWVDFADPPAASELFSVAERGDGIPGFMTLPAAHHALVIAAHSWGELPLRRLLDLIDVALVSAGCDRAEVESIAAEWKLTRLWKTTIDAADALIFDEDAPLSLRTWARALPQVRSHTVIEDHLRRWVSPFWALAPPRATMAAGIAIADYFRPRPGETWAEKLARTREAMAHPVRPVSEHNRKLGPAGVRPRFKRR